MENIIAGQYKNIDYEIYYGEDDDSSERYEGFIKIDDLSIEFCKTNRLIKYKDGWYLIIDIYWVEFEAIKGIRNVIDAIENLYLPGGSKYIESKNKIE